MSYEGFDCTIKGSKKGVAQGLLRVLSLFKGSVPSEQITATFISIGHNFNFTYIGGL